MTYYTYKRASEAYQKRSAGAGYLRIVARYTPMARLYDARRDDRLDALVVRYVADAYSGGFWKMSGRRVEFIGRESAQGGRLVVVLETLGIPLPGGWR